MVYPCHLLTFSKNNNISSSLYIIHVDFYAVPVYYRRLGQLLLFIVCNKILILRFIVINSLNTL